MASLDLSSKNSYSSLVLAIQEFESAALASGRRSGYLAVTRGTVSTMEVVLDAQERSLKRVDTARKDLHGEDGKSKGLKLIDEDVDLAELFGDGKSPLANYLQDCLGCNLRLKFDWQLKPFNLLAPINGFLDTMMAALDRLLDRINPFKILEDICWALNHFAALCPQDIIIALMAIKFLIKKYLLQMFNIKIDWTVLLGPLLKAILGALTDLLDNIMALILAPLDCTLAGLKTTNDLLHATEDFVNSVKTAGAQLDGFFSTAKTEGFGNSIVSTEQSGFMGKDVSWAQPGKTPVDDQVFPGLENLDPGQLEVSSPVKLGSPENPDAAFRLPTGFNLVGNTDIQTALANPAFKTSTWLEKIIVPVQDAIAWIKQIFDNILGSLHSLENLVGGGLALSLDNLGILLFLADVVSLLMLIIKMLTSNLQVKDWCSFLQKHPSILENALNPNLQAPNVQVRARGEGDNVELVLTRGPEQNQLGVIKTCVNNRTSADSSMLATWIKQVESSGALV